MEESVFQKIPIKSRKTVLIVEDDQFLSRLYQLQLKKQGVEVWTATNGDDAIAYLKKNPPNVIMLDIMLPGMSGFDVLTAFRANPKWKDIPVLIISNLGQAEDMKRAEMLAVKEYIVKSNMKLVDVVGRVLARLK